MNTQTESTIGTVLALLGGAVFGGMIYYLLAHLMNFPAVLALSLAMIIGGVQYFILRFIFLNIGGKKGADDEKDTPK